MCGIKMRRRERQLELALESWGGKRAGSGRKPNGAKAGVPHDGRERLASRFPVHVTVKLVRGLPSLRRAGPRSVLMGAFKSGCDRFGFRLIHYSIQSNHLHLICEAKDASALSRGMQGLQIRIAKRLNMFWGRRGKLFCDRFQAHVLRTPREVKHALCYVLHNAKKHGVRLGAALDPFASGRWFDGWRESVEDLIATPLARAHTWLLGRGWRRHRLLSLADSPAPP